MNRSHKKIPQHLEEIRQTLIAIAKNPSALQTMIQNESGLPFIDAAIMSETLPELNGTESCEDLEYLLCRALLQLTQDYNSLAALHEVGLSQLFTP